jgi:hypothetical protein
MSPVIDQETWKTSNFKHIYVVRETDLRSETDNAIGYCRTRAEVNHLIHSHGLKKFQEHLKYRSKKNKYEVSYSYIVKDESTQFIIHEKSLGYIYNGPLVDRFVIKFEKLFRTFNSIFSVEELEEMKSGMPKIANTTNNPSDNSSATVPAVPTVPTTVPK